MNCRHASEIMSQALDRPLRRSEILRLKLHLLVCAGCRRTREHFRFLREAMRRHPGQP